MNKSFCNECREVRSYKVDAAGEWFCRGCGFAIECVECGQTMTDEHADEHVTFPDSSIDGMYAP